MAKRVVRTLCFDCHSKCGILVHVDGNKIVKVEGDPDHPVSRGILCCKALSAQEIHNDPNRLTHPLKRKGLRGSGEWELISWAEAFDILESNMKKIIGQYGGTAFMVAQGTGRGANHFHFRFDASYGSAGFCLSNTHVCLMPNLLPMLHTFGALNHVDSCDVLNSGCTVAWGINTFTAWAGTAGRQVLEAKKRGMKFIVIDPRFTEQSAKADLHLMLRPGSDLALGLALTHVLIRDGIYDKEFVDKWCYGFDELAESVKDYTPEWAEDITWVPADKIVDAAHMMAEARPTNVMVSVGSSSHENGQQSGRAIANLMCILGDLDAKGGNMSNRFWDIMLDPKISLMDAEVVGRFQKMPGIKERPMMAEASSAWPHAVWESIRAKDDTDTPVRGIFCVATDLPMNYEDAEDVMESLAHLDFIAVKDYYHNSMSHIADLVLPSSHWSEREGQFDEELYSEPCPFVIPQKAVDPPGECIDDWELFLRLGKRFNEEHWPWENVQDMHRWRLKTFYDIDKTWDELQEDPYIITYGGEHRVYKKYEKGLEREDGQPGFRTPSGRCELWNAHYAGYGYDPLPVWKAPTVYEENNMTEEYPLTLTAGGRTYPYYHSAWTNIPMQRELSPDPFIEINPEVGAARGISDGEWVRVTAPGGRSICAKAVLTKAVHPRVAHLPRPGWKHACKELGLPGFDYDKANPNILLPAIPADGAYGTPPMRSWCCEIEKVGV